MGFRGFSASFFGNYDTDVGEWTEADLILDYTTNVGLIDESLERLSLSLGYTYYTFPNLDEDDRSHEIYLGLGLDILLSPTIFVYYDLDTGDGTYWDVGISHSFDFEYFSISPGANLGYNDSQWGFESSWSALLLNVNLSVPIGEYLTIGATVAESIALDSQYEDEFYGGTNLSVSF